MEFQVLGPLVVHKGSTNRTPSAPKVRNVLAMLLVHAGQVVPVPVLMRDLWGDNPPTSGATTLQTYILNLRKLFVSTTGMSAQEIAQDVLITQAGGYQLDPGVGELDVRQYQALATAGGEALSAGDDSTGTRHLRDALRLWRGPALAGVPTGQVLESKRQQFEESRLVVIEYLVDAELRLGMFREALAELASLTVANPLHEGLHAQYMRSLYMSGRRAEALEVFRRLHGKLTTELGLEPGHRIQELHMAILKSDNEMESALQPSRPLSEVVRTSAWGNTRTY